MTGELSFFTNSFIYFPLPYHRVGHVYAKTLPVGTISMSSSLNIPYGLYARLALIAITNLAYQSADIEISSFTLYELLRNIRQAHPTGGQLKKFEEQLEAWSTTLITLIYQNENKNSYRNLLIVDSADFKLEKSRRIEDEKVYIKFTDRGKAFLTETSIPIPAKAVRQIKSTFDFDVLSWLISTVFQIGEKESHNIAWPQLASQFNVSRQNRPKFKLAFISSVFDIAYAYYPEARLSIDKNGIVVYKSPLLTKQKNDLLLPYIGGESINERI